MLFIMSFVVRVSGYSCRRQPLMAIIYRIVVSISVHLHCAPAYLYHLSKQLNRLEGNWSRKKETGLATAEH